MNSTVKHFVQKSSRAGFWAAAAVMGLATKSLAAASTGQRGQFEACFIGGGLGTTIGLIAGMVVEIWMNRKEKERGYQIRGLPQAVALGGAMVGVSIGLALGS